MKKLFLSILNLGINSSSKAEDRRRIKTVNLLNLVILFFLLVGLTNYFFLETGFPLITEFLFIFIAAFALYCSYKEKTNLAFLLFTFNANLSIFFINQYYPFESGSYLYYFPAIVTVILLNNMSHKNWLALSHFLIFGVFFLLFMLLDFPQWQVKGLSSETLQAMWYYNMVITIIITALVSVLLNRLINIQNEEILKQNKDLSQAKLKIDSSLKEKEVLLAELNHRVKNNLAIISGLLNLQQDTVKNIEAKEIIKDSKNRILSMALVHKMLYNHPQLKNIDIGQYSTELIKELFISSNINDKVVLKEEYDQISLPVDKSIPFGLILNEIVTNSIKYVYKIGAESNGHLHIRIQLIKNEVLLVVKDFGQGFPINFNNAENSMSLGVFLIKSLAEQLDGKVNFSNEDGAKVELKFSLN